MAVEHSQKGHVSFIISLRHPDLVRHYALHQRHFEWTLTSLLSQLDSRFDILVVAHPAWELPLSHEKITRLDSFLPPACDDVRRMKLEKEWIRKEKGLKYLSAIYALKARPETPSHVMIVDADDRLDRRLVGAVLADNPEAIFQLQSGFAIDYPQQLAVQITQDLHEICGTCRVLPFGLFDDLPAEMNDVPESFYTQNLGSHVFNMPWLKASGRPFTALSFEAVGYLLGHGENISGVTMSFLRPLIEARMGPAPELPWNTEFLARFGLEHQERLNPCL